jgi:plasmid stability protein
LPDIFVEDTKTQVAQILIKNLEKEVIERLRQRAKRNGRTLQEEVRAILRDAVKNEA